MRPWTIDADDIQVAEDFDTQLLHKTSWIEDFLDSGHGEKFVVVGTKGFGKTLLLKAKRIRYQASGHLCIPQDTLLDKPVGNKVFSRELLGVYDTDIEPWNRVWLTSIACAVLKATGLPDELDLSPRVANLMNDRQLRSVLDHFVVLLELSPRDIHRCAQETSTQLVPLLRVLKQPVAVFIDSVDEYFNKHIHTPVWRASFSGEISPDVWFLSQMSLVEVAYQLRRITKHLKVFASVRKEAFARLTETSPMAQQYRGSVIDVAYGLGSLREIFVKNILREPRDNLASPAKLAADPIAAFLGRASTTHGFTGTEEDAFGYIVRHTMLRPRDLMTIGQRLAAMEVADRVVERDFKRAVNEAAAEVAQEYLNEIAPHLGDVDMRALLELLPSNVLSRDTLEAIATRYDEASRDRGGATGMEAFAGLLEAGLLGRVETDPLTGDQLQRFKRPGEGRLGAALVLPFAAFYLVRPVLAGFISSLNSEYASGTNRANVIGDQLQWHDAELPDEWTSRVPAYHGSEPYVYVCYSHEDARSVVTEITWLNRRGINVWYDEGIPAGSRWTDELAGRIRHAAVFLFFVSESSVVSNHCLNEINFVIDLDKPIVSVFLSDIRLPDGLKLMLGAKQTVRRYDLTTELYRHRLEHALLDGLTS